MHGNRQMTLQLQSTDSHPAIPFWLALFLACAACGTASAQNVSLDLTGGDKISGLIVSETTNQVVISNAWVKALPVPLADIVKRETNHLARTAPPAPPAAQEQTALSAKSEAKPAQELAVKLPAKPKGTLNGQIRFGLNTIYNTRDQQDYFGNLKLTYTQPYAAHPKKFFRNTAELHAQYQEIDGQQSGNRADGSNKSDFDLGEKSYGYGLAGAGYDEVRKIDFQYQVGPGLGHHLVQQKNFAFNIESGLNYEAQYRRDTDNLETFYLRFGTDSTWKILDNLKLTHNVAFYPDMEHEGQYRNDFTSNLSYGFWKALSLNLTLLDQYNTQVAPGVDRNRFELRSSLGVTF
jgi:putative salt-induced outer membrane protein YdiY